jgi:hypothetical protein
VRPELRALEVADPPARWEALGFTVQDGVVALGGVAVRLGAGGEGIVGWSVSGLGAEVDGLPLVPPPEVPAPSRHPNGASGIDHVVVLTPDFERTASALGAAGMPLRRTFDGLRGRMGFRRLGPAILEVVARPDVPDGPARFWGLAVAVPAFDALGDCVGPVRDAVQPGRQIATVPRDAGISPGLAFITG